MSIHLTKFILTFHIFIASKVDVLSLSITQTQSYILNVFDFMCYEDKDSNLSIRYVVVVRDDLLLRVPVQEYFWDECGFSLT